MAAAQRMLQLVSILCLAHAVISVLNEEDALSLVEIDASPPLPSLPNLRQSLAKPSETVHSLGEQGGTKQSKQYDSPLDEMKALESEDHDANIKAMEKEEHLKATARAAEEEVPDDVQCYMDLRTEAQNQKAMAERLESQAKDAKERLESAALARDRALGVAQKLKRRMERDQQSKNEAEEQYRKEHSTAMNAFEAAKGNLDNYNTDRKKVDLDATRSKQVLQKYLEYKKKFIEASAEAENPTQSREVDQYKKLSEQYLTSYHGLQRKIQESYTSAQRESELYTQLSQRYQKIAGDANDIAAEVSKSSADLLKSRRAHKEKQAEYEKHASEAQKWGQTHTQKSEAAKTANDKYAKVQDHMKRSKVNYLKLNALSAKYQEMGEQSKRKVELNRVRLFNFEQDIQKTAKEIEAAVKSVALLKRKYETADAAGMVYTKSYRANGCATGIEEPSAEEAKDTEKSVTDGTEDTQDGEEEEAEEVPLEEEEAEEEEEQDQTDQAEKQEEGKQEAEPAEQAEEPSVSLSNSVVELLQQEPATGETDVKYSAEQCEQDKAIATQNLEAAEMAKKDHQKELTHLHILKEDHATSESGAHTSKAIMVGSKAKAKKYLQVAEHAAAQAKNPCDV